MSMRIDRTNFFFDGGPNNEAVAYDTLKLTHSQWESVVERIKLMAGTVSHISREKRQHGRSEALGLFQINLEIKHPGGTVTRMLARSHDLSPQGLGFIHGNYIHPTSTCICSLRHMSEGITPITGTIRWCRHIHGAVYMSGVELDETIRVEDYLPDMADPEISSLTDLGSE